MGSPLPYVLFVGICVTVLKQFNTVVPEPYMDEPFHIPQAQAYCNGDYLHWDPKITTPPGLYVSSLILKHAFMLKCNVPMLRLTTLLPLMALPVVVSRLLAYHQRGRLPKILEPSFDALVLSSFPIAWFFGFLYYTEVPSLLFVVVTVVLAMQQKHWLAGFFGLVSCTFRQTNVVWVLYAYAMSQLMHLRFRRAMPNAKPLEKLHDPPALDAEPSDLVRAFVSAPKVLLDILPAFIPYGFVLASFGAFVVWNGGIVLGDKSNHIPTLHVPQLYYFVAFATAFGWPVLISGQGGPSGLVFAVKNRMFGSGLRILSTTLLVLAMGVTVHLFTIHHPFLLSDNRHYTFYIWHRIYMRFPAPYLLIPIYIACGWAWFLRVGEKQTILQTLLLPLLVIPTLLPTPLLEPRYFLIPYILLRAQVAETPTWALALEGIWYAGINAATMWRTRSPIFRFFPPPFSFSTPILHIMPNEGTPSKPTTRSSIRHSFSLAGKALADVINKDSDKGKKHSKDASLRRTSGVETKAVAPRASLGDVRPSSISSRRAMTPDSKTATRRRQSVIIAGKLSLDEPPSKAVEATLQGAGVTRSASLRPRPGVSALPKYRPKSIVGEPLKSHSPARVGVRRRLSTSDEDEKEQQTPQQQTKESPEEKRRRPISPLPHRAALKASSVSTNSPSGVTPPKVKPGTPVSIGKAKGSPVRPTKSVKTGASSQPTAPRPSSSASSSSSFTPHTPKGSTPALKSSIAARRADKPSASPLSQSPKRGQTESPFARQTESPLARHSRNASQRTVPSESSDVGNMSHISEGGSEDDDSDSEEVELLLAPVAVLGAPTPAMPRHITTRRKSRAAPPQTPTRSQLPTRANLSYLSPLPPDKDFSPSLRPDSKGGASAGRGSILSWDQLASESSRTLGEDEIASMLADIPAPFRSGAMTPNHLEVPESPALSALNSPGEFGSISQILLPEVTPSPAVRDGMRFNKDPSAPAVDSATITLLRLQIVSLESTGKERLFQMQALEQQLHDSKQARARDVQEMQTQLAVLEEQLRSSLMQRERADEDRAAYVRSLEEQLAHADAAREQAIDDVAADTRADVEAEAEATFRVQYAKASAVSSARAAAMQWAFVRDFADDELDAIQGDKLVLASLLSGLDQLQAKLRD
ncbi:unnamed protein product [Mycena citricolor]|uniref:Dol-P-Glc:Glc(2)Man(9)GlcNAc(2)-PP-Dol alpha-1,2-glucosyltransferase n=1 Tax=Mycena citricolor TaxID=2018698 RepID=A0AAD2Q604_9AGAR|nr:unnamed protein product [Mycena citricolor]